jgi:hypothetical protein
MGSDHVSGLRDLNARSVRRSSLELTRTSLRWRPGGLARWWLLTVISCIALAACGSGSSDHRVRHEPSGAAVGNAVVATQPPYGVQCSPSQLRLYAGGQVSEQTEQHTLPLVLHNASATRCDLRAYPGVTLLDSRGVRLPFEYRRHRDQELTSAQPAVVALPPDGDGYMAINKNTCVAREREIAARIHVTLPNGHPPLALALSRYPILGYCGSGDPGHIVDITPIEPTLKAVFASR